MNRQTTPWVRTARFLATAALLFCAIGVGRAEVMQIAFDNFDVNMNTCITEPVTGTTAIWALTDGTTQPAYSGDVALFLNSATATAGDTARISRIVPLNVAPYANLTVTFAIYHGGSSLMNARVQAQASTNNGADWVNVGDPIYLFDETTGWTVHTVDFSDYDHATSLRYGLLGVSYQQADVYMDDLGLNGETMNCTPTEGTIGTRLTLFGSGFGEVPGKVAVGDAACKPDEGWSDTRLVCTVSKLPKAGPGSYDVNVQPKLPKGAEPVELATSFQVMAPQITDVDPPEGLPGDTITVTGLYFTTGKVKVSLYSSEMGKPVSCKVLSSNMNPLNNASATEFVVPAKLPPGSYDVIVTGKAGAGTIQDAFQRSATP